MWYNSDQRLQAEHLFILVKFLLLSAFCICCIRLFHKCLSCISNFVIHTSHHGWHYTLLHLNGKFKFLLIFKEIISPHTHTLVFSADNFKARNGCHANEAYSPAAFSLSIHEFSSEISVVMEIIWIIGERAGTESWLTGKVKQREFRPAETYVGQNTWKITQFQKATFITFIHSKSKTGL